MLRYAIALGFFLLTSTYDPEIRYFSNVRNVTVSDPNKQNYIVIDEETWKYTRRELADIRLYDGTTQVPYVLEEQNRKTSTVEKAAKILNLGRVGDRTEFDLEITGVPQYDRIRLKVDAKNFVTTALLFGKNGPGQGPGTQLGPSTMYDFSREKLGSNYVLQLPSSSFPYLHVQLTSGVGPEQVKGASVFDIQERQAYWTKAGHCGDPIQEGKNTIVRCHLLDGMPLERVRFAVLPEQTNFRRAVSVSAGASQIANDEITRVQMNRSGVQVTSEQTSVEVPGLRDHRDFSVTIANGDDPPLKLTSVQVEALQRRIYFDPGGRSVVKMYYGDPALGSPVYDYAKFFREDPTAAESQLGADLNNAEYSPRPDERPWSERHNVLLWGAMVLAVAVLGVLALRGLSGNSNA